MKPMELTYGYEGFQEIRDFLKNNYHKGYTLSIYDNIEKATIEVICDFDSMVNVIIYVSNTENNFPAWIGVDELSESYVVGMDFLRGYLRTPSVCEWKDDRLVERK